MCREKADEQVHLEGKGTQADNVCFIITAAEVRKAMIDRRHLTRVVSSREEPVAVVDSFPRPVKPEIFWSNFGAIQERPETDKRNQSNAI